MEDKLHILRPEAAGDTKHYLHQDAVTSLAAVRLTWRKLVVACSAAECHFFNQMTLITGRVYPKQFENYFPNFWTSPASSENMFTKQITFCRNTPASYPTAYKITLTISEGFGARNFHPTKPNQSQLWHMQFEEAVIILSCLCFEH